MKKKLVLATVMLIGEGSSFSQEFPSPFEHQNPFGSPSGEPSNPFGPPPFHGSQMSEPSPFQAPAENPFGSPSAESSNPFSDHLGGAQPSPFGPPPGRERSNPFSEGASAAESSPFGPPPANNPFGAPVAGSPFSSSEEEDHSPFESHEGFGERPAVGQPGQEQRFPFGEQRSEARPPLEPFRAPDKGFEKPLYQSGESIKEEKESPEDEAIDSEVDTFDKDGGNWVLKRVWWEKIEAVYEQIKQVFNDIMTARMDFISQRNKLDRELDVFYGQMGLEEGQLQDVLDDAIALLKKERTEEGFLDKADEAFYQLLQGKQRDIEQIKLDIKALQELDQKIDEALDTLFKQIDVANQYEQKAWETFKDVARELNDKIARKSYYETEGLLKDIQNVHTYITGQFSSYFMQTIQGAQTHSRSITTQMEGLKQNGLDLKRRFEELEQAQEAKVVEKDVQKEQAALKEEQEKKRKEAESKTFVNRIKLWFLEMAEAVTNGFASIGERIQSWFTSKESAIVAREKKLEVTASAKTREVQALIAKKQQEITGSAVTEEHSKQLRAPSRHHDKKEAPSQDAKASFKASQKTSSSEQPEKSLFTRVKEWFLGEEVVVVAKDKQHKKELDQNLEKSVDTFIKEVQVDLGDEEQKLNKFLGEGGTHSSSLHEPVSDVSPELPKTFSGLTEDEDHKASSELLEGFDHNPFEREDHVALSYKESERGQSLMDHPVSMSAHEDQERLPVSVLPQPRNEAALQEHMSPFHAPVQGQESEHRLPVEHTLMREPEENPFEKAVIKAPMNASGASRPAVSVMPHEENQFGHPPVEELAQNEIHESSPFAK